jgi:triphosphatase
MTELELKLQVPAEVAASLRAELRRRGARTMPLAAVYYDTPDFALARRTMALRVRREGRRWIQTLKAEGRSLVDRIEHNVPLRANGSGAPAPDAARFDATAAGAALQAALAHAEPPRLDAVYRTDIRRLACDLELPGAVVEAAFDEGAIVAGARSVPVHELELELKSGDVRALCALAASWSVFGGLWLDTRTKSARGLQLARDEPFGAAVKATRVEVDAAMTGPVFLRAVVRATLDQVLANTSEIAAGHATEAHVHQARVGLRRLRTALRELRALDARADALVDTQWAEPLARTFAQLGVARDAVTAARAARPLLERAHAPKLQWETGAHVDATSVVRDPAFQRVLLDLLAYALEAPPQGDAVDPAAVRAHLRQGLARLHTRVGHAARDFASRPFDAQHTARKRLKRLRYLAEFAAPLFEAKRVRNYLDSLAPAQDALGTHVDIEVAMEKFRADAADDAQALFAAGYLEAHLADTARVAQAALKKVAKAQPFWEH